MALPQWTYLETDQSSIVALQTASDLSRPIALVLAQRGVTPHNIKDFLYPSLKNLTDPYAIPGTFVAAERLWQAAKNQETVMIHGDYDTDGITAAVLLSRILTKNAISSQVFLPHRVDDGYGLTAETVIKAKNAGVSLLITVDCGITSLEAAEEASKQGIELIITDHHEPGFKLPEALAVINPKMGGAPPETRQLAGVGVAFKLAHAFLKFGRDNELGGLTTDLKDYLDLVALGTVADIVPLLHENRLLARHGLKTLSRQHRPGIRALCEYAGLNGDKFAASDIAFRLAPRINAPGRMENASLSMALLDATSMSEATVLAAQVNDINQQRRDLENQVVKLAEDQLAKSEFTPENTSVVVCGSDWHPGVLGIVAARLARSYHKPAAVFSRHTNGSLCGSVRSVLGVNLIEVLRSMENILKRFGGHAMAAGVSIAQEDLTHFRRQFESAIRQFRLPEAISPQLMIDGIISISELTDRFFEERNLLEPFGQDNPEPVFVCRNIRPAWKNLAGKEHTRGEIEESNGCKIGFIAFRRTPENFPEPPWDAAVKPYLNSYNSCVRPQVEIIDIRAAQ